MKAWSFQGRRKDLILQLMEIMWVRMPWGNDVGEDHGGNGTDRMD